MDEQITNVDIEKAIELIKVEKYKIFLKDFKKGFHEGDSLVVTSHHNQFEIIVSRPSTGDYTGGAEQYFLNKITGKVRMGWHEHPIAIPKHE